MRRWAVVIDDDAVDNHVKNHFFPPPSIPTQHFMVHALSFFLFVRVIFLSRSVSTMYEGYPFPTQRMIDDKWSVKRVLGHSEFGVRVKKIKEQCRVTGCNHGIETITTAKFIRVLYVTNELPSDIQASLEEDGFLFSEKGEMISYSYTDLYINDPIPHFSPSLRHS